MQAVAFELQACLMPQAASGCIKASYGRPHITILNSIVEFSWLTHTNKFVCKWKAENQFREDGSSRNWRRTSDRKLEKSTSWRSPANVIRAIRQKVSFYSKVSSRFGCIFKHFGGWHKTVFGCSFFWASINETGLWALHKYVACTGCIAAGWNFRMASDPIHRIPSPKENQVIKYLLIELDWAISRSISGPSSPKDWRYEVLHGSSGSSGSLPIFMGPPMGPKFSTPLPWLSDG